MRSVQYHKMPEHMRKALIHIVHDVKDLDHKDQLLKDKTGLSLALEVDDHGNQSLVYSIVDEEQFTIWSLSL